VLPCCLVVIMLSAAAFGTLTMITCMAHSWQCSQHRLYANLHLQQEWSRLREVNITPDNRAYA
jgi:hypothetical protein